MKKTKGRKKAKKRSFMNIFLILVISYLAICFAMWVLQGYIIFIPDRNLHDPASYEIDMQEQSITTSDGIKLTTWYRPAQEGQPTIIFFHGNAGNLGVRANKYKNFYSDGFGVLALSYRGYGSSEGKPSERGLYDDARTAIKSLMERGIKTEDMIFYGESLGTGVAVQMATEFNAKAVVLEAPYTSISELGQSIYKLLPVSFLLHQKFDSLSKIKDVKEPLLVMHGDIDKVVPISFGKKLFAAANEPKKMVIFPGHDHSDDNSAEVIKIIREFIAGSSS